MWRILVGSLCLALFALIIADDIYLDKHCEGKPDGNYDIACKAYISCTNGLAHQVFCMNGQVYNHDTGKCDAPEKSPPPCGVPQNCTNRDGRYPDLDNKCKSYFICLRGQFMSHQDCPQGLVFNKTLEICDWPYDVFPPCGTRLK